MGPPANGPKKRKSGSGKSADLGSDRTLVVEYVHGEVVARYGKAGQRLSGSSGEQQSATGGYRRVLRILKTAFLPEEFPDSVAEDYLAFQAWDTVQALCSYIRGLLTANAILSGVGVGQQAATPLAAVFLFFVRDLAGMLGGILFAFWQGSSFDTCAKQWRLFADVTNDVGMAVELASPLFPRAFLAMACFGSIARAVTGVAGGATRAALTSHFALRGNAADVSAKESSQETATTLIGMVLGMVFTRATAGHVLSAWVLFVVLTFLHVWANVRALRCLVLRSVNTPRLEVLVDHYLTIGTVPSPLQMAALESLVPPPFKPAFAWLPHWRRQSCWPGSVQLGVSLRQVARSAGASPSQLAQLVHSAAASGQPYVIGASGPGVCHAAVAIHRDFQSAPHLLQAMTHALVLLHSRTAQSQPVGPPHSDSQPQTSGRSGSMDDSMACSAEWMRSSYAAFTRACKDQGWDLGHVLLKSPATLISYTLVVGGKLE